MRIYLLCHEVDPVISPLKYLLDELQINFIYSSPCKKVLDTISPYCDMKDLQINIEYGLSEKDTSWRSKDVFNHLVTMYQKYESMNILLAANANVLTQMLDLEEYEWSIGGLALGYDDSFCGNTSEKDYRRGIGRQFMPINFELKSKKSIIREILEDIVENIVEDIQISLSLSLI